MIDLPTAYLCVLVLFIAGILEFISTNLSKMSRYSGVLCSLGFFMLAARYFYLSWNNDVSRLSFYGTGSIMALALGRIISCADAIKNETAAH